MVVPSCNSHDYYIALFILLRVRIHTLKSTTMYMRASAYVWRYIDIHPVIYIVRLYTMTYSACVCVCTCLIIIMPSFVWRNSDNNVCPRPLFGVLNKHIHTHIYYIACSVVCRVYLIRPCTPSQVRSRNIVQTSQTHARTCARLLHKKHTHTHILFSQNSSIPHSHRLTA